MRSKLYITVLFLISFLDTLNFGLIMPVLPAYILNSGGNHNVLGIAATLYTLLQLFSVPFGRNYSENYGKKVSLLITLCIGLLTNITMGIVSKYLSVIMLRLIFYLTNQTQTICKAFIADYEHKEKHSSIYSKMNLLGVLGFIIGPIVGGYLFDMENGFYYISLTAFFLSQISILLALTLPRDEPKSADKQTTNLAEKLAENIKSSLQSLQKLQLYNFWNIALMKILMTMSLTAFFMKLSFLLKVHYKISNTVVGYTLAYQSILLFLCSFLVPLSDKIYKDQYMKKFLHSLSLLTISVANVCYAPTYVMYLICFIPTSIAKCIVDSAWHNMNDFLKNSNKSLKSIPTALDTVATLTGIITPAIYGYFCELYKQNAVKGFSIIPLAISMLLLHLSTMKQFTRSKLN